MNISLLVDSATYLPSNKDIIRLKLLILKYTVLCAVSDDSQLKLFPRRGTNGNKGIDKPIFLTDKIDPCFEPALGANSIGGVKISKLNGFLIQEMPFPNKVSILNINLGVSNKPIFRQVISNIS